MFIKQIKGVFGIFDGESVEFSKGLNIIKRDNEWGKSTLVALLKVMFFDLNSSKRDRKDYLSEKTKYTKDQSFSGEMIINYNNKDIVITRKKGNKSSEFQSYFLDTGIKTEYSSKDIGEILLGVSEDAYCNSALIEWDNRLMNKTEDIENLILSMSTTGDPSNSFESSMKNLKSKRTQIVRSYKEFLQNDTIDSTKVLNEHENISQNIKTLEGLKSQVVEKIAEKRELYEEEFRKGSIVKFEVNERTSIINHESEEIINFLSDDYYEMDLIKEVVRSYKKFVENEKNEFEFRTKLNDYSLTIDKRVFALNRKREKAILDNSKVSFKKLPFYFSIFLAVLAFASMFIDFNLSFDNRYIATGFSLSSIISLLFSFNFKKNNISINEHYDNLIDDLYSQASNLKEKHKEYSSQVETLFANMLNLGKKIGCKNPKSKEDIVNRVTYVVAINERYHKALEFKTISGGTANVYEKDKIINHEQTIEKLKNDLSVLESKLKEVETEIIRKKVYKESLPSIENLIRSKDLKHEKEKAVNFDVGSIDLAINALEIANTNLTTRLSPRISHIASNYFEFLTNSKYNTVVLQENLEVFCKSEYSLLSKLELSSGTKDQLYLALRLAICDVLLPENTPIILDDPFVFYDDLRTKKAIELLEIIAKKRQVLLFTCHSREQKYIAN